MFLFLYKGQYNWKFSNIVFTLFWSVDTLIRNDRSGGKIGVNDDLNAFIVGRTRTARVGEI
jgi:hypothetical protein